MARFDDLYHRTSMMYIIVWSLMKGKIYILFNLQNILVNLQT